MCLPENEFRNRKKPWPREQALRTRLSSTGKGIVAVKCRSSPREGGDRAGPRRGPKSLLCDPSALLCGGDGHGRAGPRTKTENMGLGLATRLAWGQGTLRSNVWLVVSLLYHVTRDAGGVRPARRGSGQRGLPPFPPCGRRPGAGGEKMWSS